MKFFLTLMFAVAAQAAYEGDLVQYWVEQTSVLLNSTAVGGLPSPTAAWISATVQFSVFLATRFTEAGPIWNKQIALSHAAHDTLAWAFHGVRLGNEIDNALRAVQPLIGIPPDSDDYRQVSRVGQEAAERVIRARQNDGFHNFIDYTFGPKNPGVYQPTPGGRPLPDTPQAAHVRPFGFGGVQNIKSFRAPEPPRPTAAGYDKWVLEVLQLGSIDSTRRTKEQTDIAYFWQESSVTAWNRYAHAIVGNRFASEPVDSSQFYAQLNFALANAAIAAWDSKFHWNHWRPVTAIHRQGVWLKSGRNIYDPNWVPLLRPTPSHQDYVSTHAAFGGAAAAVLKSINGGDRINAAFSSNVTLDNKGVITRRFRSIDRAATENARSRIFGGIHFTYAGDAGLKQGYAIGEETVKLFEQNWDKEEGFWN